MFNAPEICFSEGSKAFILQKKETFDNFKFCAFLQEMFQLKMRKDATIYESHFELKIFLILFVNKLKIVSTSFE